MTRKRAFLLVQAMLCTLSALLLAAAAIHICLDGLSVRAAGNPLTWIYTRETAGAMLLRAAPACLLTLLWPVLGRILKIRNDLPDPPVSVRTPAPGVFREQNSRPASARPQLVLRLVLLAAALALIVAGILNGSIQDVLVKAINLCTECVGLG